MHLICSTDMKCMVCASVCSRLVKKTILQTKHRKVVLGFLSLLTFEFDGMLMLFCCVNVARRFEGSLSILGGQAAL